MESTVDVLRTRLAQVPIENLGAVHALFTEVMKLNREARAADGLEYAVLMRRAERKMGQAIRHGQNAGKVLVQGQSKTKTGILSVADLLGPGASKKHQAIYSVTDGVTDEAFEEALQKCMDVGSATRASVAHALSGRKVEAKKVPNPRSNRHVEQIAITINAIATGLNDIDPAEVSLAQVGESVDRIFEDVGMIRSFLRKVNKANEQ